MLAGKRDCVRLKDTTTTKTLNVSQNYKNISKILKSHFLHSQHAIAYKIVERCGGMVASGSESDARPEGRAFKILADP